MKKLLPQVLFLFILLPPVFFYGQIEPTYYESLTIEINEQIFPLDKDIIKDEYLPILDSLVEQIIKYYPQMVDIILIERMDYSMCCFDITMRRARTVINQLNKYEFIQIPYSIEIVRFDPDGIYATLKTNYHSPRIILVLNR